MNEISLLSSKASPYWTVPKELHRPWLESRGWQVVVTDSIGEISDLSQSEALN